MTKGLNKLMTKRSAILCLLTLLGCIKLSAQQQRFFNLTVEDVKIDSVLPHFHYAIPVGEQYADSVYELEIRYPEFMDMSKTDIERYNALTAVIPPSLPEIHRQMTVERKKGVLEISLMPIVQRNGRKQFLVSFMIALTSRPRTKTARGRKDIATRTGVMQPTSAASHYAEHSVLASGKWAKIRVPSSGVYQLTPELIRRAGFSHMNKVKVYGYGGNLQDEVLTADFITSHDDLQEVPTYDTGGRRLFYARGPINWEQNTSSRRIRNPYSDYGCYFLTEDDSGTPAVIADSTEFLNSFYPAADDYHSLHEVDDFSWYHGGRNLFEKTPLKLNESKVFTLANKAHTAAGRLTVAITTGT